MLGEGKHADRAIAAALARAAAGPAPLPDHRFISQSVFALFRWRGWIEPLHLQRPEARLLLAWLLDAPERPPGLPGLGPRDRPRPGPARRAGRCPELDRPGRGTEALARRPRRHRRPLAALPRLAPRAPAAAARAGPRPRSATSSCSTPSRRPPPLWVRAQGADEAGPLDRAARGGPEALGPSPRHARGQARRPTPTSITSPPSSAATSRSRTSPRRPSPSPATPTPASAGGTPAPGPAARRSTSPP